MTLLTTGLIENTVISGVRPTTDLVVRISNDDVVAVSVLIAGFFVTGPTKTQYVEELLNILPGNVTTRTYFAQFNAFEFQFTTSSIATEISLWGKNAAGDLTAAHRAVPEELSIFG